jgi:translation initiation factor 5B
MSVRGTAGEKLSFGNVMSIEKDKKPIESATRLTGSVAIRIEQKRNMKEYTFGRHWDHEALFVSALNRESIDLLKEHFRDEVPKEVFLVSPSTFTRSFMFPYPLYPKP